MMSFIKYRKYNEIKVKNRRVILNRHFYVYRITNLIQKKHYYGSRVSVAEPKLDIGIKYFSSSYDKEFMLEQKEFPERFRYKVVRVCANNIEKQLFESYMHEKFNVGASDNFYNQVRQTLEGFDSTGHTYNRGRKLSDSTKEKLREAFTGRYVSEETREKQRAIALARTKEENLLRGAPHKGKKISEHTRKLFCKKNTGSGNPASKVITVFDSKDNIVMVSHGTFKKDCERNNFPWATLRQAKNGKKLYINSDGTVSKNMLESSRKFIGWYIVCK